MLDLPHSPIAKLNFKFLWIKKRSYVFWGSIYPKLPNIRKIKKKARYKRFPNERITGKLWILIADKMQRGTTIFLSWNKTFPTEKRS